MSFIIPSDVQAAQRQAINPANSVWVSANAGSGKTWVLTKRVIRLLLNGAKPARILCLTYTKAAAANMQQRVFEELAAWTAFDDAALSAEIAKLEGEPPGPEGLAKARRLFAEAVETPGGLRIQTIHAFCERLLHLFPLEANVPANFEVLDDAGAAALYASAQEAMLQTALAHPDDPIGRALSRLNREISLVDLGEALRAAMRHRLALTQFAGWRANEAHLPSPVRVHFGVGAEETMAALDREALAGGIASSEWPAVAAALAEHGSSNDAKRAKALLLAHEASEIETKAQLYRAVFFTKKFEAPLQAIVTGSIDKAAPYLAERLKAEQARIVANHRRRQVLAAVERSEALLLLAIFVDARIGAAKQNRGVLDFDDLIERVDALLERASSAWVLYKLDGGIDHLLVDEAQDTSPQQWQILKNLTGDFFSGESKHAGLRTIFAVGDEKQSIYSFQGADPAGFSSMRRYFAGAVTASGGHFAPVTLKLSFRSASQVLDAVDAVFGESERRRGLIADGEAVTPHISARRNAPGLVELWPPVAPDSEEGETSEGVDALTGASPPVQLARRIARRIALWLRQGDRLPGRAAPISAGDILILVRGRNAFFEAVIRALKQQGVPVAGADRLVLTDHIAVMDLIALGRFALLPDDDLILATVLKSPLGGFDDADLLRLAPLRSGSLWQALSESGEPQDRALRARLERWRRLAADADPFEFYATVLGRDGGRRALLDRLGLDAGEAIEVFLSDALAYGQRNPPSLLGFLDRTLAEERQIKRDMDAPGDAVRVMTVHAAKGLEAPIVFLADTFSHPMPQHDPKIFRLGGGEGANLPATIVWSPSSKQDPGDVALLRQSTREKAWDEYRRLLYVGLTRARDRLYIAGYLGKRPSDKPAWYRLIAKTLEEAGQLGQVRTVRAEDGEGEVLQWGEPGGGALKAVAGSQDAPAAALPDYLLQDAPHEAAAAPPLRPSHLIAAPDQQATARPVSGDARARQRGVLLHRLFELLPDLPLEARRAGGVALLRQRGLFGEEAAALVDIVLASLADPLAAALFGPDSRAEVAMSGTLHGHQVNGRADRLVIRPHEILVADMKTGRPPADPAAIPETVLAQLAAYRAVLSDIYPGRAVRAFVLWTAMPRLVEAESAQLDRVVAGFSRS